MCCDVSDLLSQDESVGRSSISRGTFTLVYCQQLHLEEQEVNTHTYEFFHTPSVDLNRKCTMVRSELLNLHPISPAYLSIISL